MIPTNDFRAILKARDEKRARLATQHSGPDPETIAHGTDAATQTPQSSSHRPVGLDGGRPGVSPWWVVVALGVGFLAGWYGLFLAIVGRT